jgi:hypothetical protein
VTPGVSLLAKACATFARNLFVSGGSYPNVPLAPKHYRATFRVKEANSKRIPKKRKKSLNLSHQRVS